MKKQHMLAGFIAFLAIIGCLAGACKGGDDNSENDNEQKSPVISVTGVTLNKNTLSLNVGEEETLLPTIQPQNATNKAVTWTSSDATIASVDSSGKVSALSAGSANITVTTQDGGKTASCALTVQTVAVTGVSLNFTEAILNIGDTETLIPRFTPLNATNKNVSWSSSDEDVAAVSGGVVTALKSGSAVITVTTQDGSHSAECSFTVNKAQESFSITFDQIEDEAPQISGPVIHRSSANGQTTATLTVVNPQQYSSIEWSLYGRSGSGASFTLSAADAYNTLGEHTVSLEVIKNGVPYNRNITFTVAE